MALIKKWCLRAESNHRHGDFQSPALPTELQRRFLQRLFSILYSLRNVNNFFQKFLYILQAGENSHRSSACDCFTFLFRLRRICPHNKSAALSFSCGSSHTVQPKIVQAKRASFIYAWSSILSAAGLAVFYIRIASRQKILVQCNVSFSAGIFLGVVLLHP